MANIIIDDTSNRMRKPNLWTLASTGVRSYGGSSTLFREVASVGDTIKIDFHGTSITLHGMAPPAPAPTFNASIDNKSISEHTSQNAFVSPGTTGQWYTSPLIPSGAHSLSVGMLYGASIDYAIVQAGWDTPMMGERVVVDADADLGGGGRGPLVFYAVREDGMVEEGAAWTRRAEQFVATDDPKTGWPYGNATMETAIVGAGARFRFTGTSLAIYGIFNYTTPGVLSVIYTIDAFPLTKTYAVSPSSPEHTSGTLQRENTLLFANDSLAPGDHTLTLEVTRAVNLSLVLDYFVYEAAFESVGVMPNLTVEAPEAGSASLEGNVDTGHGGGGSGRKPIAAIVGGVLSGLLVMCVVVVLLLWWKRRRRSLGKEKHISSDAQLTPFSVDATSPTTAAPVRIQPACPGSTSIEPYIFAASPTSPTFQEKPNMPVSLAPAAASHSQHPSTSSSPPPLLHGDVKHGGVSVSTPPPQVAPPPRFSISNPRTSPPESADEEGRGGSFNGRGVFGTGRMQRLQELVLELDSEIMEGGDGTARVAELRERIAVLSREGLGAGARREREWGQYGVGADEDGGGEGSGRRRGRERETMGTLPPPYELRE